MATRAKGSFGTQLFRKNDGGTWDLVPEAKDFDGLEIENVMEEVTNQDSPQGFDEHVPTGAKNLSELTFDMNLLDGDVIQDAMIADAQSGTIRTYRLVYAKGTRRIEFDGYVRTVGNAFAVKGTMQRNMAIKSSGPWARSTHP